MPDIGSIIAKATSEGGILPLVYADLAQPGVRQVGKALKTVLELGNTLLLPLRLVNETAKQFEERKFSEIAERFSSIPDEEIIDVSPEIGVPIMEKLSHTQDETLRNMFIELLGKAATNSLVSQAHPSFVNVISSLCPDEAILLESLRVNNFHPFMTIEAKVDKGSGSSLMQDLVVIPPSGLVCKGNLPLYLSNFSGLGLIEIRRGTHLTAPGAYDQLEAYAKSEFRWPQNFTLGEIAHTIVYKKHIIALLPYGRSFIEACAPR